MRALLAAMLIAVAAGSWTPAGAADGLRITKIRAHLFYEHTGRLSQDIIGAGEVFWNTIIGEGLAEEPASNFLVVVEMAGVDGAAREQLLVVQVTTEGEKPRVVTTKRFEFLYIDPGDPGIARGVWVEDATCDTVRIAATHGTDRREAKIDFRCGE